MYGESLIHRIVWTHNKGAIAKGLCVMHSCDNRVCCNINHLSLGTWADNNRDRTEKGRGGDLSGEKNPASKIGESDVLYIRSLKGKFPSKEVAELYGIHFSTICRIWNNVTWRHI
jgi:hypothetical protein